MSRRDDLFADLLKRQGIGRDSDRVIEPPDGDPFADLSFAQQRFWFLDQFQPAHPIYNGCKAVRILGEPNVYVLRECLQLIVQRHEVLRTTFASPDGNPVPRISQTSHIELPITELEGSVGSRLRSLVQDLARKEWLEPFNLVEQLPIRARLWRIDPKQYLLLLSLHQIAGDSQSVVILFRELWTSYEAKVCGESPSLPSLTLQYRDFAKWQRERVASQAFHSQREYWRQQLTPLPPALDLPTDFPRPPTQSFDGARLAVSLTVDLQQRLKQLSREHGVTLFMTLLAGFKILLHRYCSQEDVSVGCPMLNRRLPGTENVIGCFMNTVVLRTRLSGALTFLDALRNVRQTCIEAFANDDFPFERLVEELQPIRDLAHNPLFQVMFAFQNTSIPVLEIADLRSEVVEIDGGMTKFDLTLSLFDKEQGIGGHIEYSTALFQRETIERMAKHYEVLLEGIVADANQPISGLPLLSPDERRQLVYEWNETKADYPKDKSIHELFALQAARTPNEIAIQFAKQQLTYAELDHLSRQVANYLVNKLGVGSGALVGICVERSLEMLIGLLGILRAGGAYVPLDPRYPAERLRFMLENAGCSVLLTQQSLVEDGGLTMGDGNSLSSILDARINLVCLDRDGSMIAQQSDDSARQSFDSENLAYVIYTSGSTGVPKGVEVSHRSVVNCLLSIQKTISLAPLDVWLAVTTISFDIAALEMFLPLITGAKLVIASQDEAHDGTELLAKVQESGATVMQATPTSWNLLLDAGWTKALGFKVLCGGEALSRALADRLLETGASLWNLYGPTETTVWSTMHKVEMGDERVYIGRPIANTEIRILDAQLEPVPIGVHGDLYIGGDGLAPGYLNRPELTAERFIRNPFGDDLGARLYKTGDRVRYHSNGVIEFLGRSDNQVKIRGHRIELGEIEATLTQHPAIKDAVVVARGRDVADENGLVGYFVARELTTVTAAELRSSLKEKLPSPMIPPYLVQLEKLPLTLNGKIDRNALPPPEGSAPASHGIGLVEPRSELEEIVAQVWREVLKRDRLGIHDNFFALGGHSLLITRVAARLRANFHVNLPLRKLFELPTVFEQASHIEFVLQSGKGISIPPIVAVSRDQNLPLSFSQLRLWFLRQLDRDLTAYNMPSVFRIRGGLDISVLERAINSLIARHEILRTIFVEKGGIPVQIILPQLEIQLPISNLAHLPVSTRATTVQESAAGMAAQPFELTSGPLLRINLIRSDEQEFYLVLIVDHMILDGASKAILLSELSDSYAALLDGREESMTAPKVQYADFAVWQNDRLRDGSLDIELLYWKRRLESPAAAMEFPLDHSRPAVQTSRGARLTKTLSPELTLALKELSRRQGVTLFMTLLAAFGVIFSRHTGSEEVGVGSTFAGRNRAETENLLGFFVNALPLRVDLSGNPTFVEMLRRVREVCLDAYTHQDVPFEKIVEAVSPQRNLSRNPLFQVLFNVVDVSERALPLSGCEVAAVQIFEPEAKFDLTLYAPEKDGAIELAVVYNLDLFDPAHISAILDQYADLLAQAVAEPQRVIREYSLLTGSAKALLPDPHARLSDDWEGALHELFSRFVDEAPERLAVSDCADDWSYADLEHASNQLANELSASGIKPKDVVAIYACRDASLIVTLLGVLKAGGVFTILDPVYPAERLIAYLRVAQPRGWVQLKGAGAPGREIQTYLDVAEIVYRCELPQSKEEISERLHDESASCPAIVIGAGDPAYVAFTSGSTGEPKGVLSRHGPITHFLAWQTSAWGLREDDRFAVLSGLAYNHLHRDVFTPLAMGASVYVPPSEIAREPVSLCEWLNKHSITILHLTPALGQMLRTAGATLPSVRRIFFGGDVLTQGEVAEIHAMAPNATIGCFYGATETQRAVGYYEIPVDFKLNESDANRPIPLGRGIEDVQLLVLNKQMQQAGIGELGELYVRSPHLAEGYVNDDERTAAVFITNPFTNDQVDRLCKTGELARYLPDGNVEWAGRNDRRVNIRGFRVELEEIEAVLKQHPTVKDAAAAIVEIERADSDNPKSKIENPKSLVAYVVTDEEDSQSWKDLLHSYVSSRLPDYMVPAHFVVLEQLPLTPNGKVDYLALSSRQIESSESEPLSSQPRNDVEKKLCEIFGEVLGREAVGIGENFFRIGGHSLSAAQAAARIREAFDIGFDLRVFFENPTVIGLAKEIQLRLQGLITAPIKDETDREEIEI